MENVYSSERRHVAPKFVIFRTALLSLLLVGTLATVSEVISFAYIEIAQLDNFLCFIWPGITGFSCGVLGAVYIHYPALSSRWFLAKMIVGLAAVTVFCTLASIVYRILLIHQLLVNRIHRSADRMKLVLLHFSFSLILELALFALSVLIANVTLTMYKLRTIIDGEDQSTTAATPDSASIQDTRYQNLGEENV